MHAFPRIRFDLAVVLACLVTLATFGWHGFMGKRGVGYQAELAAREVQLQAQLDGLKKEQAALDKKLALLRPESVDPDMVDELVRANLGLVQGGDLIVITGSTMAAP
jgi:cell division protein FtsB